MSKLVIIEADGGSRGNPGPAGSGAVLIDAQTGSVLAEIAMFIGVATNNVAEYRAVLAAVDVANEIAPDAELLVRMDSKLVVEQMSGRWKVKNEGMQDLFQSMQQSIGTRKISFEWIPREQNGKADALANEAMDAEKSVVRKYVGSADTSTISVVTSSSKVVAADLEYNPELPSSVRAPRNISKKLTTITAQATCNFELLLLNLTCKNAVLTRSILKEMGIDQSEPTIIYCDNQSVKN